MNRKLAIDKSWYLKILVILISGYGIYLRFQRYSQRELWSDELFQFINIEGPFRSFWKNISCISGDHSSFPGEYLLNFPFVQWFGLNKWAIAIPHIAATLLGFFLLYKICQQHLKTFAGYCIVFLIAAFNENLIFHSFEFRPYAMLPTLALANLYLTREAITHFDQMTFGKKLFLFLFFMISINYHAYGILIFLLPAVYNILTISQISLRNLTKKSTKFLGISLLAGLTIWCWFASINQFGLKPPPQKQHQNSVGRKAIESLLSREDSKIKNAEKRREQTTEQRGIVEEQSDVDTFQYIPSPKNNMVGFLKGVIGNLIGLKVFYIFLVGLFIMLFPHPARRKQLIYFIVLIFLPIGLILLVDVLTHYWFLQRQFTWVMPFFALFLGWQWDSMINFSLAKFRKAKEI